MPKRRVAWLVPPKGIFNYELDMSAFEGLDVQIDKVAVSSPGEAIEAVKGADVVMAMAGAVDAQLIAAMDKAKAICSFGHGFDRIDVEAAAKAGIMVTNTAYICNWEVANHAAAMILGLNRKIVLYDRAMRSGVWDRPAGRPIGPLDGEVAGLIGLGAIGRSLAKRLQPFGLIVKAYDPLAEDWVFREYQVERVFSLEALLGDSDYVSIQVPHNKNTHHMMSEKQFRAMKKSAFFVNCCRGGVHDEKALYRALKEGWIAGAGLDVFEEEPTDPKNPLLSLTNVIATPHAAGESTLSLDWAMKVASHQAAAVLRGDWPNRVVNPEARQHLRKA
ncbi:MAG: C-terminal binding protein [Dehalococcoidia bacterium]|nr:C-terminal binding protein [Dehalococcoidia bacterium]MSQ34975.1 C-terminal binding protein [Dehalococcoidia bacterium]